MSSGKYLAKHTVLYTVANGLGRGMPFILMPLMTKHLTVVDFGIYGLASTLVALLGIVVGLNPHLFIMSHYYKLSRNELGTYVYNFLLIGLTTVLACIILFSALQPFIPAYFTFFSMLVILLLALNRFSTNLFLTIFQMMGSAGLYCFYYILQSATLIVVLILFVYYNRLQWTTALTVEFSISLLLNLFVFIYLFRRSFIITKYDHGSMKSIVTFSLPLVAHVIAIWGINYVDRFILAKIEGVNAVGIYTVANSLALGLSLIHESISRAVQPKLYQTLQTGGIDANNLMLRYAWRYAGLTVMLYILYVGGCRMVFPYIFSTAYEPVLNYFPILAVGYSFLGLYRIVGTYFYHFEHTAKLTSITVSVAIINILVNILLISLCGALGAAIATTFSFFLLLASVTHYSSKMYGVQWLYFKTVQ